MKFQILTIFPEIFNSYFSESIIKRAQEKKIISLKIHNLRDYTTDKRRTVDDTPYGGGAGMILKIEPLYKALKKISKKSDKIILLSAKGKKWGQTLAKKYSRLKEITFVCGRYEGVDERIKELIDEEVSIGDYVLTGGELGAMVIVDSLTRLLPGSLGNKKSSEDESHSQPGVLEYPHYTKPESFKVNNKTMKVPKILLSGNHRKIALWREKHRPKPKKYKSLKIPLL